MFAYRLVQVPDFCLFFADAGVKPVKKQAATPTETPGASSGASSTPASPGASAGVVKLSATQHRNKQRRRQKQRAADLPPASGPTAIFADSQSHATECQKQAEREAMLSQQAAAAQTASASVADLKLTSDQAKSAVVPASIQPQIVSALQPASKAVQRSVVSADDDVQPPLVELKTVKTTTATELVSTPGAVLPITWL